MNANYFYLKAVYQYLHVQYQVNQFTITLCIIGFSIFNRESAIYSNGALNSYRKHTGTQLSDLHILGFY